MRRTVIVIVACALCGGAWPVAAQQSPRATAVTPGKPVTVTVRIPTENRPAGILTYEVEPVAGVELLGGRTGPLTWDPAVGNDLHVVLRLIVRATQPRGRFAASRIAVRWSNGHRDSIDVWLVVKPAPLPTGSSKALDAEVVAVPGAAPPGGTVKLRFTISNNEETDERLRLRVAGGRGWALQDSEDEEREWLVAAYGEIQGEVRVAVPAEALPASRQLIRLLVEVVGEPGAIEAQNYVSITAPDQTPAAASQLSGTSTLGVTRVAPRGFREARTASAFEMATTFGESALTFSYDRGLRDNLSNYRYDEEPARAAGNLRHGGWDIDFGSHVPSPGGVLYGPYVQGIGGSGRRTAGRVLADLVITRPTEFGGNAAGHLVRGRAGVKTKTAVLALAASDFSRPDGGYTTLPSVQQIPLGADDEEDLEIERAFTGKAPSNRVSGAGVDLEFRPARGHRLTVRGGGLRLANAAGERTGGFAGEGAYSFSSPQKAAVNVRWRETPPTLAGIFIAGDELAADGNLRMATPLRIVGRAFRNSSTTIGRDLHTSAHGGSLGLRYQRQGHRIEVRGNYRESEFVARNVRQTLAVLGSMPLGPLTLSANAEIGQQDSGKKVTPVAFYRGDLRLIREAGTMSLAATHSETNGVGRTRLDFIGSLPLRRWELAGGAWATRGYTFGGRPGMWASVGVPVRREALITLGIDRAPIDWAAPPTWRATFAIQKRFAVPLPFHASAKTEGLEPVRGPRAASACSSVPQPVGECGLQVSPVQTLR